MSQSLADELAAIPALRDLSDDDRRWIADRSEINELQPGEILTRPGDPPDWLQFLLQGEIHMYPEPQARDAGRLYVMRAPNITGMLPFSRMKRIPRLTKAATYLRYASFPAAQIPELLRNIPAIEPRLVEVLADRIKETTQFEQQSEKLASLGRLAAGLAHELNNPAAAARRAAAALRVTIREAEASTARLAVAVGLETVSKLVALREELDGRPARHLSTLDRSDCEDVLANVLDDLGVEESWRAAPSLVDSGVDKAWLLRFLEPVPQAARTTAIDCLESHLRAGELLRTVEDAAERISRLVGAVKEYTYMDRAQAHEVDIHEGIDSTIRILSNKLKGILVRREYAPNLPRITAFGGELNQVWTNILDNAADALQGAGEIVIRTSTVDDRVAVEIIDSGPGMTKEVVDRVFDPFFTTKGVGAGTGLGLDIARRVVEAQHFGVIHVDSRPGATSFRIELPIHRPATEILRDMD